MVQPFNNLSTLRIPRLVSLVVGLPSGRTWAKTIPFLSRVKCVSTFWVGHGGRKESRKKKSQVREKSSWGIKGPSPQHHFVEPGNNKTQTVVIHAIVKVAYDKIWSWAIKRGVVKHVSSLHVLSLHSMFYHSSPFHVLSFASKSKTWQKWYTAKPLWYELLLQCSLLDQKK